MQIGSPHSRTLARTALALLTSLALPLAQPLQAQCQLAWQPGPSASGVVGTGFAIDAMPSGGVVVAGRFSAAGNIIANYVARYDGTSFHALGDGVDNDVYAVVALPNGDVIVGGEFLNAGGNQANHIARWDGSAWSPMGSGTNSRVYALAALPNGDVIAAGLFAFAGGVPCNGIARWDGSSWSALGSGPALLDVTTIEVGPNGDLYAAGTSPTGFHVQRWDGSSWSNLPGVAANELDRPQDLQFLPNGDLALVAAASATRIQIWDGSQVSELQPPFAGLFGLGVAPNGDLLVMRLATLLGNPVIQRFDGTSWTAIGGIAGTVNETAIDSSGNLFAAGSSFGADQRALLKITGNTISGEPAGPPPAIIEHTVTLPNGDVVLAGLFDQIDGTAANNIAIWDGTNYQALGQGVDGRVTALAATNGGELVVAGEFGNAGGAPAPNIARWSSAGWTPVPGGINGIARHLAINDAGEILAVLSNSTTNGLRWFDGQNWIPQALNNGTIEDVIALPSGDFVLGGQFFYSTQPPVGGLVFSSGSLQPLDGSQFTKIAAMAVNPAGSLVVSEATPLGTIAVVVPGGRALLWSGSTLRLPTALQYLPDGDLVAALPDVGVSRRTNNQWAVIDGGIRSLYFSDEVREFSFSNRGELAAVGYFGTAGNNVAQSFARARTNCPASATSLGAGCSGSAGPVNLTAEVLPWLGTTFRSTATGMTPSSLAVQVLGTQQVTVSLPFGAPGCNLLVDPIQLGILLTEGGEAAALFEISPNTALLGREVLSQVIGLELSGSMALQQTTASNALQLTLGAF